MHKGTKVFIFIEEDKFDAAEQHVFAVMGGSLMYRLPRVQDPNATFTDQEGHEESIRWFSRTGSQLEQANTVEEVVIPHDCPHPRRTDPQEPQLGGHIPTLDDHPR